MVSWKTLAQVEPVKQGSRMVPSSRSDILALDRKDARVQGFMIPLDMGDKQKHFLVSAVPPHCSFCLPAGPEASSRCGEGRRSATRSIRSSCPAGSRC